MEIFFVYFDGGHFTLLWLMRQPFLKLEFIAENGFCSFHWGTNVIVDIRSTTGPLEDVPLSLDWFWYSFVEREATRLLEMIWKVTFFGCRKVALNSSYFWIHVGSLFGFL